MRLIHLAVALMLLTIPLVSDCSEADSCSLKISHVCPTETFEGFAISNYGSTRDLKGYSVTDGEGTVNFTESISIRFGETIYFCKCQTPDWFDIEKVIIYGSSGVTMKGFALADSGDDIYLMEGDRVIDAFAYGEVKKAVDGWKGDAFQKIPKKHIAARNTVYDTDSAADWSLTVPGRSHYSANTYDAKVTPISFPDDYDPLFVALQKASGSIDISVYLISHPVVVSSLISSLQNGVSVNILVEGSPAGGMTPAEIKALKTLSVKGADVRIMKQIDGYRAYSYLHNKYAVIDSETTVITSENWQESSFSSNRGWGAVVESGEFSAFMDRVFRSDFGRSNDVVTFNEMFPTADTMAFDRYVPYVSNTVSYDAKVTPVLSPDNSYDSMRSFILSAEDRVYSEQLEVDYTWTIDSDCPVSWMKSVSDMADCRLLIDTTFDDRNDGDFRDGFGVIDSLSSSNIRTKSPVFSGLSHNKGVISDDRVWVGSVNWTANSFGDNREAAVVIDSPDIADYFSRLFLSDWGETSVTEEEMRIDVQNIDDAFLFQVTGIGDGDKVSWDTDGDGVFDTDGRRIVMRMPEGKNMIIVRVDDGIQERYDKVVVTSELGDRSEPLIPIKYYPIIVICILVLAVNAIRWSRRKDVPDKGVQRFRR